MPHKEKLYISHKLTQWTPPRSNVLCVLRVDEHTLFVPNFILAALSHHFTSREKLICLNAHRKGKPALLQNSQFGRTPKNHLKISQPWKWQTTLYFFINILWILQTANRYPKFQTDENWSILMFSVSSLFFFFFLFFLINWGRAKGIKLELS